MEETRYKFDQDDDGHWYLIPVNKIHDFNRLLYDKDETGMEAWERDEWQKFEDMRIDSMGSYSFTNPVEDYE